MRAIGLARMGFWSAAVVAVLAAIGSAFGGVAAGGPEAGWIVLPDGTDQPGRAAVYRLVAGAPPVTIARAFSLSSVPEYLAAGPGRVVVVYNPVPQGDAGGLMRQVRVVEYDRSPQGQPWRYGQPTPRAPLPGEGELTDIAVVGAADLVALVRTAGGESTKGAQPWRLLRLRGAKWVEWTLPAQLRTSANLHLLRFDARAALMDLGETSTHLWLADSTESGSWQRVADLAAVPGSARVIAGGRQFFVISSEGGKARLGLLRDSGVWLLAELTPQGPQQWIVPVGGLVQAIWSDGSVSPELTSVTVSPTGQVIYTGPVQTLSPLGARDLQVLGLLLASVVLTIGVFVLRPTSASHAAINLPDGYALAEPWRRAVAASIDAVVGLVAASAIWAIPVADLVNPASPRFAEVGIWPLLTAAGLLIAISALGEMLTGRTPGKAIMGCRTVSFRGDRPGPFQALARNTIKVLCPPFGLISLMGVDPRSSPASFGTAVIVRIRSDEDSQADR